MALKIPGTVQSSKRKRSIAGGTPASQTRRVVAKPLPSMAGRTSIVAPGVNEYQTVWLGKPEERPQIINGSPDSVVASVISCISLNGNPPMAMASAKLSFAGGAARAVDILSNAS